MRFRLFIRDKKPDLIILDSLVRFMTGDENSVKDVRLLFQGLKKLANEEGVTIICIHHLRKAGSFGNSGGSSGTSSTSGTSGIQGNTGNPGSSGTSGADGSFLGTNGTSGLSGSSGKDGIFSSNR